MKRHLASLAILVAAAAQAGTAHVPAGLSVSIRASEFPSAELGSPIIISLSDAKKTYRFRFGDLRLASLTLVALSNCRARIELTSSEWETSRTPASWPAEFRPGDGFSLAYRFGHEVQRLEGTLLGEENCGLRP